MRAAVAICAVAMLVPASLAHAAQCTRADVAELLRAGWIEADARDKIGYYARRMERYYDRRRTTRRAVLREMLDFQDTWRDRDYRLINVRSVLEEDTARCTAKFTYRFSAYDPSRQRDSTGVGEATIIFSMDPERGTLRQIVAEYGDVLCRGRRAFRRERCN